MQEKQERAREPRRGTFYAHFLNKQKEKRGTDGIQTMY